MNRGRIGVSLYGKADTINIQEYYQSSVLYPSWCSYCRLYGGGRGRGGHLKILPTKKLSFCSELKLSNLYFFETLWCKPLIFQTQAFWSNRIDNLNYQRSKTSGLEFVSKTQFLYQPIAEGSYYQKEVNENLLTFIGLPLFPLLADCRG